MTSFGSTDEPISSSSMDRLGLGLYAESLARFVSSCETPMTVAVQGDWGTGKTSLMNMVREQIKRQEVGRRSETIWFSAWQYSQFSSEDRLPAALLSSFLRQLVPNDGSTIATALRAISFLAKPAASTAVRVMTGGAFELSDLGTWDKNVDLAAEAETLKSEIKKVVDQKIASGVDRIYVFIDDLDRVNPRRSVEILEVLKSFLDLEACIFVLAIDYSVVKRGLFEKFGFDETEIGGRSFFDKIIQLPFSLPVDRFDIDSYVESLLKGVRSSVHSEDYTLFAALATLAVTANPRSIKRLFNNFDLVMLIANGHDPATETDNPASIRSSIRNLFAVLCIQIGFEALHSWLVKKASVLSASDLMHLGAYKNSAPADLMDAISSIPEFRRRHLDAFIPLFLKAVQSPTTIDENFDNDELEALKSALTWSRVTSVNGGVESEDDDYDVQFRWRNREMLKVVLGKWRDRIQSAAPEKVDLKFYQRRASEQANLYTEFASLKSIKVELRHEKENIRVYIHGGRGYREISELVMKAAVLEDLELQQEEREIWLLHLPLKGDESIEVRHSLIEERAMPVYLRAVAYLGSVRG